MLSSDVGNLQRISMFRDIDASKLKLIVLASQRANYRPGERLLLQGDRADAVFVILEGKARITRNDSGQDVQIAMVEGGSVVGEMGVVLDKPYSGTIVAQTALVALRIDKRTFLDLLAQVPQFSLAVIRELATRLLETSDRYVKVMSK